MAIESAPVEVGQVLAGKYRAEKILGEGGMGVVVLAFDEALDRRVAIKFLLPEFAQHAEATERFLREARAAVRIQSEHVARVIDVGSMNDGAPYMVMEYLEGADLSQIIEQDGPVELESACLYLIQACEAIAEAHAQGIIHRDLKPANLFLARQAGGAQKVKVLDFGISKVSDSLLSRREVSLTRTSTAMGSPLYMSPEQMRSTRDVDARTDIWALGIILYETLTGDTPFTGESVPELSAQILLEAPYPIQQRVPSLPTELATVVEKALRKDPSERYPNVGDLAEALLPFAPQRARGNVERIVRVLGAAGMSTADFQASISPNIKTKAGVGDAGRFSKTSPALAGTAVNFGQTQGPLLSSGNTISRWTLALAGGAVAMGLGLALVLSTDAESPQPVPATATQPTPMLVPNTGRSEQLSANAVAAKPSAMAKPGEPPAGPRSTPAATGPHTNTPAAALPTPQPKASSTRIAVRTAKPTPAKTRKKKAVSRTKRAPRRPPAKKTYTGDFKSKFGSRK